MRIFKVFTKLFKSMRANWKTLKVQEKLILNCPRAKLCPVSFAVELEIAETVTKNIRL